VSAFGAITRAIGAASAHGARGRTSHNPPVVGSSPTRPTYPHLRKRSIWPGWSVCLPHRCGHGGRDDPAERFAERRKRRQEPWLAKLEPVRPGPVARHHGLTRYPGPKPPPFARRGADGHGRRRVRGIPQPERQSTHHLRGWPPRPTPGLTQRPGKRQSRPLCATASHAGLRPAKSIN
jgi:hypothetical protein